MAALPASVGTTPDFPAYEREWGHITADGLSKLVLLHREVERSSVIRTRG